MQSEEMDGVSQHATSVCDTFRKVLRPQVQVLDEMVDVRCVSLQGLGELTSTRKQFLRVREGILERWIKTRRTI